MKRILDFFVGKPKEKPMDLSNFEEAKDRLHKSAKSAAKELDAFGDMVLGMRDFAQPRRRKKISRKR